MYASELIKILADEMKDGDFNVEALVSGRETYIGIFIS